MAGELIGALRVALGWDTAGFEAGSKKARAEAKSTARSIQGTLTDLKNTATALATGAVATAVLAAGKAALDYASSLGEVAQQLGVTTRDLQVFRFAATQVGVSQEEMDKGLSKLTLTIGQAADGSKKQASAFNDLGINVRTVGGDIRTASDIIPQLADALAQIKDPATRARVEVELFGKTGQKLDTLLAGGSAAINELATAAEKAGVVLSPQLIQNADDAADKLAAVKMVLEANIAAVVAENAGAIVSLANALVGLAGWAGKASQAWRVFMLTQQAKSAEQMTTGWSGLFISNEAKLKALQQASDLRGQINEIINPKRSVAGKGGGLFDAQSNPLDVGGALGGLIANRPMAGLNRVAATGGGGKKKGDGGVAAAIKRAEKEEQDFQDEIRKLGAAPIADLAGAREAAGQFYQGLGIDLDGDLAKIREELDVKREGARDLADFERNLQENRVRDLAGLLEDQLTGAGGSFWRQFQSMGLRVAAQIAARLLTNNGGQGGGLGAILSASGSSVFGGLTSLFSGLGGLGGTRGTGITFNDYGRTGLPGLAGGGTIRGFGGVDRNLLSINGMGVARVNRGEQIKVEPANDRRGAPVHFHLEGAVLTQDLVNQMNAIGQGAQIGAIGAVEQRAARRARTRL